MNDIPPAVPAPGGTSVTEPGSTKPGLWAAIGVIVGLVAGGLFGFLAFHTPGTATVTPKATPTATALSPSATVSASASATAAPTTVSIPVPAPTTTPQRLLDIPSLTLRLPIPQSFSRLGYEPQKPQLGGAAEVHFTASVGSATCDAGFLDVQDRDPGQPLDSYVRKVGNRWYIQVLPNGAPDPGCQGVNDAMHSALLGAQPIG